MRDRFKVAKIRAKKEYEEKMEEIIYWQKVNKAFRLHKKKNDEFFKMSFPHDIFSNFVKDDEIKIEAFANEYGYELSDETLLGGRTIYYFEKL